MSAIYAWLRRHRVLVDTALAVVIFLLSLGQAVPGGWATLLIAVVMTAPIAFRRRAPILAFAICITGGAWQMIAAISSLPGSGPIACDVAVLVLIYTVAAYRPRRDSIIAMLICLAGSALAVIAWIPVARPVPVQPLSPPAPAGQLLARVLFAVVLFGGSTLTAWVLGDSMRYRRGYYAELEDKAARLEAERNAQAKVAAAAERARIARELHDVVAHHVSVMVVQADGAGYALHSDPDRAAAALNAISCTGRQALTEMRRLLGVLRSTADQAQLAPMPGLGELRELLDQAREAGLEVSYTLTGIPRELPEGADLAAYRVVQESLTNTRKHAGLAASAAVTLRYEPDWLIVEVTDNGMATPVGEAGGHGLVGMRERITMYGGTIQAGPLAGGGFGVVARLPCPAAGPARVDADAGNRPTVARHGDAAADQRPAVTVTAASGAQ
ncbi:MAG: sensor histidine kinase [Streptosporangiaceae bacterium]